LRHPWARTWPGSITIWRFVGGKARENSALQSGRDGLIDNSPQLCAYIAVFLRSPCAKLALGHVLAGRLIDGAFLAIDHSAKRFLRLSTLHQDDPWPCAGLPSLIQYINPSESQLIPSVDKKIELGTEYSPAHSTL
jgi:hypothetical protein